MKYSEITIEHIKDWEDNYLYLFTPEVVLEGESFDPTNEDDFEEISRINCLLGDIDNGEPVLYCRNESLKNRTHESRANGIYLSHNTNGFFDEGDFAIIVIDGKIVGHVTYEELDYISENY